jgi:hypothetical protein
MSGKLSICYVVQGNTDISTHSTDSPAEAEEVIMHLLLSQSQIRSIRREGAALTRREFDEVLKKAAERIVFEILRGSLSLDSAEVRARFCLAA